MFIHCKLTSVYNLSHLVILTESNMHSHRAIKKNVQICPKEYLILVVQTVAWGSNQRFLCAKSICHPIPQKSVWLVNLLYGGGWGELGEESKKGHWRGSC